MNEIENVERISFYLNNKWLNAKEEATCTELIRHTKNTESSNLSKAM